MNKIPFNKPFLTGNEVTLISEAIASRELSGNGSFTNKCTNWLEETIRVQKAFLTNSCTAALEMSAVLIDIQPGDEVILPSFTFVTSATSFVLRGAVPVFVDIDPISLNMSAEAAEQAITSKTKAIVAVHYAGHDCNIRGLKDLCNTNDIFLIEDAAQAIISLDSTGCPLGQAGDLACFSFHETKNIMCGEGGALLINNTELIERAEVVYEKGTDRSRFLAGHIDKYTWRDIGSSYYPSEITAAFLFAQLEAAREITSMRRSLWSSYHIHLSEIAGRYFTLPAIPYNSQRNNAHIYYIMANDLNQRNAIIDYLKGKMIMAVFHYIPLHSSPAGRRYGRTSGDLQVTNTVSQRLVRLPLWIGLETSRVTKALEQMNLD
jgi:dTDP-4-amino-4,6-dideoxygalactose transaminase